MFPVTAGKLKNDIYDIGTHKVLKLRMERQVTAQRVFFTKDAKPSLRAGWLAKLSTLPHGNVELNNELMQARPVYLVPGRGNKLAILVGDRDWGEFPANDLPFRSWMTREGRTSFETQWLSANVDQSDQVNNPGIVGFYYGASTYDVWGATGGGSNDPSTIGLPLAFEMWKGLGLGQGIKLLVHVHKEYAPGTTEYEGRALGIRSTGSVEPGFARAGDGSQSLSAVFDASAPVYFDSNEGAGNPYAGTIYHHYMYNINDVGQTQGWRLIPRPNHPKQQEALALLQRNQGFLDFIGVTPELGSFFPFPCVSKRVGWVVGFGHSHGPVMIEIDSFAVVKGEGDVVVSWASIDVNGAQFKSMFPVDQAPSAEQANVTAALSALSNDILFRTAVSKKGFTYGTVSYDDCVMAKDAARAGGTLDDLFFDDLDDSKPPVSFNFLGAQSLVAIQKNRNVYATVVLAQDEATFIRQGALSFTRVTRDGSPVIVCNQDQVGEITAPAALVAIRTGAKVVWQPQNNGGLTPTEVAVGFFVMPSWEAVTDLLDSTGVSRDYYVGENSLTGDLRWNTTDDEIARAMPLLYGFDRTPFAHAMGSMIFGVTKPEI